MLNNEDIKIAKQDVKDFQESYKLATKDLLEAIAWKNKMKYKMKCKCKTK